MKKQVNNCAAVLLPFRQENPAQVLLEIKDNTHPLVLVRGCFCPIGGNWIGEAAAKDTGPLSTLRREIIEELTLKGKKVSTKELVLLGLATDSEAYETERFALEPSESDKKAFNAFLAAMVQGLTPFGAYINTVTAAAMQSADPSCNRPDSAGLCCYYTVPLDEPEWTNLTALQRRFGNLSNESVTTITSLHTILKQNLRGAFAHEQVLRDFWLGMGLSAAKEMPIVPDQTSLFAGPIPATYADILEQYEVARKPANLT